jgi:hypothetical protein
VLSTENANVAAFAGEVAREADRIDADFALVYFSQSLVSADDLAPALSAAAPALAYAGCSTAGEITPAGLTDGHMVAILFPRSRFRVATTLLSGLSTRGMQRIAAEVRQLRRGFATPRQREDEAHVFALCLIDGLSYAEEAVTSAIHWGLDDIPLIGGSAGDDMKFETTTVIHNGTVAMDSAVVILVATDVPFHVFKTENFVPTEEKLVVTASNPDRRVVHEFNASVAAEEFASAVGVPQDALGPLSFASHPVVVRVGGEYYCRSIQKLNADGSLSFFCAIDDGIVLSIAKPTGMVETTRRALRDVSDRIGGIDMILGFDCVLRRLDAQNRQVLREISELYRANRVVGFGTYGEQYRAMHLNQTFTGIAFGHRPAAS